MPTGIEYTKVAFRLALDEIKAYFPPFWKFIGDTASITFEFMKDKFVSEFKLGIYDALKYVSLLSMTTQRNPNRV